MCERMRSHERCPAVTTPTRQTSLPPHYHPIRPTIVAGTLVALDISGLTRREQLAMLLDIFSRVVGWPITITGQVYAPARTRGVSLATAVPRCAVQGWRSPARWCGASADQRGRSDRSGHRITLEGMIHTRLSQQARCTPGQSGAGPGEPRWQLRRLGLFGRNVTA